MMSVRGPIRRSRRKDTSKRTATVRTRMNLQNIAPATVQPRYHDDLVSHGEPVESRSYIRNYLKPSVGRAFGTLFWRIGARL